MDRSSAARLLALALSAACVGALSGCPNPGAGDDAGSGLLTDGGTLDPPPPHDAGFDDSGTALPDDAGINVDVTVTSVTPPNGPLLGGNRVVIEGTGFTSDSQVFFGDNQADPTFVLPVFLPTKLSAHVPPCDAPGIIPVRVVNALGVGIYESGFTCFSPVTITSISPESGSTEGGTQVTVTGEGLSDSMIVLIGGRAAVDVQLTDDTGTEAIMFTPPADEPGVVDVTALDAFGRSVLAYGFTYNSPLTLTDVEPNIVDDNGSVVELHGSGFYDTATSTLDATIGGLAAARINLISDSRLRVVVPAGLTGMQDVVLTRDTDSVTLANGLVVRPAATGALALIGVIPTQADIAGGSTHTLVGDGLSTVTSVTIGGTAATGVVAVDDRTVTFVAPIGTAGAATITATRADATSATLDGFEYIRPILANTIAPPQGPTTGLTDVSIIGRGFLGVTDVLFGGVSATNVAVVSDGSITATTPPGAAGPVDITFVRDDAARGVFEYAFRYDAPLSVLGVRPSRGGVGGDTFVTVSGSGFTRGTSISVMFGGQPANSVQVISDNLLTLRTPANEAGIVDVVVTNSFSETTTGSGLYTFFVPTNILGGAGGGPIDGAVYVTALDGTTGFPIPGLVAYVGTGPTPIAAGITDLVGMATISSPEVVGNQTVTVLGTGYSSVTWVDINATNLTAYLIPLTGEGEGEGEPPPPPPTIRGRVFGFAKEFFDPAALAPGEIAVAVVVTTDRDEYSNSPNPGGANAVFQEGGEYFIADARPGRLAVIALAGIFNQNTGEFRMKQMGVRREVFTQPGVNLVDQDVELSIPLDADIDLSLPDAPLRFDATNIGFAPTITRVIPYIQFGGEGTLAYTQAVDGDRNHALEGMPDVPGPMLTFVAGAYTTDGRNLLADDGTVTIVAGSRTVQGSSAFDWAVNSGGGTDPLIVGQIFVVDGPSGERFASIINACERRLDLQGTDFLPGCQDSTSDADALVSLTLEDPAPFDIAGAAYHIGQPGAPSSEVIQDGVGDLRAGVTIQPVLGLPELITPLENGVLADRTMRWKAAPGQQPSIHDMFVYEPFTFSCVWEFFVDGGRGKVIIPRVPEYQAILDALPPDQSAFLSGFDDFIPPAEMPPAGYFWQHESIFVPAMDFNDWSQFGTISTRGRRAWTTEVHTFVKGEDPAQQ